MKKVHLIGFLLTALFLAACQRDGFRLDLSVGPYAKETRKVLLLYEAGNNSLGEDVSKNISSVTKGYLPGNGRNEDVLLVASHVQWGEAPVLIRIYKEYGLPVMDTLYTWPAGTTMVDAAMVKEVFKMVRNRFPAAGYGAVMASHSTGWLPKGSFGTRSMEAPTTRSFGQDEDTSDEIELKDLAAAFPYRLDYLIFDSCLMGGIEVAWELRNKCDLLVVSPCEIPNTGFDYSKLTTRLLKSETPDLKAVCDDYINGYSNGGKSLGATVTLVKCDSLYHLRWVCKALFNKEQYHSSILGLDGSKVQMYDRDDYDYRHTFFDLKDLLYKAGISDSEKYDLQRALDVAILYKRDTGWFGSKALDNCCGLSMYLPWDGNEEKSDAYRGTRILDEYYRENISWNEMTHLVW